MECQIPQEELLLTAAQAAERLSMTPQFLAMDRMRRDSNMLPYVKIGRAVRYRVGDINTFIASRRIIPSAE
jgi:hypothetical protein